MFTGLIEALGTVRAAVPDDAGRFFDISDATVTHDLPIGASIAINGVCLTVISCAADTFRVQAGPETLRLTNLGELQPGQRVNLERALQVGARLGGHIVQGHVDGVGHIHRREQQGEWETIWFTCPKELTKYMVTKGSIAVDGISLTLVDVLPAGFSVALIPHTLALTTLGHKQPGATVNLETDLIGKYVSKHLDVSP